MKKRNCHYVVISPRPIPHTMKGRGRFWSKICLLLCSIWLNPNMSIAQAHPTIATIQSFQQNYSSKKAIAPLKVLYKESHFIRFNELGAIYNPTFPNTRDKVYVRTYQQEGDDLFYIGYSISTFRATVLQKGRVGKFYTIMQGPNCNSMIAYQAKKEGAYLIITGMLYKCFSTP